MHHSRVLVVVAGNAGHGKDTFANAMAASRSDVGRDAYAAPLKHCVHLKTGIPMWVLQADAAVKNDPKYGAYGKTPRKLMQEEGEEARQRIGLTVWMDRLAERFLASQDRILVVSDGRHPEEEMSALRERIGDRALVVCVRIVRPDVPVVRDHVSETRVADVPDSFFDYKVVNDGSPEDLAAKAETLLHVVTARAMTGKKSAPAWKIVCGNKSWPMTFSSDVDANMCAVEPMQPCPICGLTKDHYVMPVDASCVMVR
jgi:hypothetical protein